MMEPLRGALLARGWTEQVDDDSPILPRLFWLSRANGVVIEGSPIVSRLILGRHFCYKDVLLDYARSQPNRGKNIDLVVPRTFKLFTGERNEFMENYRLTAYASFIRFLKATGTKAFSETGKISPKWISYAIEKLEAIIAPENNEVETSATVKREMQQKIDNEFEKFKKIYQSIVKFKSKIDLQSADRNDLLDQCNVIYRKCKKVWKDFENDGFYNLWLLKPARGSLGNGIKLFDEDVDILCHATNNKNLKYLVQKYIERPMLIYNTKFDLRQYFLLVHHATGIHLWMYKKSYLKFSTKLYDPLNYKVSIHITNTAVQSKYSIDKNRSRNIPQCNEWSSDRFLAYLNKQNKSTLWDNKIYPAMKQNIIATVSASVEFTVIQPNHFQLYGCDFVIDENHNPILLEINGFPTLTSVICAMCLEDLVKVIIDRREDPRADTGHFEKVWEMNL
ncbi:tubulin glycylase 3B-like [Bradysia coprophila]|uniref:tubulin glycylase 3B-like n=1 Tax=Bradysia coprophila TaxID=38358 RepID=UPI00187D9472|nr:tubulin glycylase 3B-like [Bradysia coprophila]